MFKKDNLRTQGGNSINWPDEAFSFIEKHGIQMARIATPRGWRKNLETRFGDVRGRCFDVNLSIAYQSNEYWYCEGLADGIPHAWLSPKIDKPTWVIDCTWGWRYPNGKVLDNVDYVGIAVNGVDVVDFLVNRGKVLPTSATLLKYISEVDFAAMSLRSNAHAQASTSLYS